VELDQQLIFLMRSSPTLLSRKAIAPLAQCKWALTQEGLYPKFRSPDRTTLVRTTRVIWLEVT
jgi:hypothetical protein